MEKTCLAFVLLIFILNPLYAQAPFSEKTQLFWDKNIADLGAVMEEDGDVSAEFVFVNRANFPIFIEEIITDCGCTTASYTRDTLSQNETGSIKISYTPTVRAGAFSKTVVVKTNIDSEGDSLILEGYNIPYPQSIESHYSNLRGALGFYAPAINMGDVFTNEPKTKYVDFYNSRDFPLMINLVKTVIPDHIKLRFLPMVVPPKSRGLLEIQYDGQMKQDFGFFEEQLEIVLTAEDEPPINLGLMANVLEYFDPVPVSEVDKVPKLVVSELEVDLNRIDANRPVTRVISLRNEGGRALNIRKVVSNCECLVFSLKKNDLQVGEQVDLSFTFNPRGRRGIDHKTLTFFSNDPLNPAQTVVIKSRIQ